MLSGVSVEFARPHLLHLDILARDIFDIMPDCRLAPRAQASEFRLGFIVDLAFVEFRSASFAAIGPVGRSSARDARPGQQLDRLGGDNAQDRQVRGHDPERQFRDRVCERESCRVFCYTSARASGREDGMETYT